MSDLTHLMLDPTNPVDTANYGPPGDPKHMRGPDETSCWNCKRLALDHTPGQYSVYGVCPPPMSVTEALDALRGLFAAGPDTAIRTTWHDGLEHWEVPADDFRPILHDLLRDHRSR